MLRTGGTLGSAFIADFDGDGRPDVLSSNDAVYYGSGARAFGRVHPVPVFASMDQDMNGDGAPDIVSKNQVYVGRTPPLASDNLCTNLRPGLDLCIDPASF